MHDGLLSTVRLTLGIAAFATGCTLVPGTWLAYVLARREFPGKSVVSTLVILPLVLPPTAVGWMLLRLFAFDGPIARVLGFDPGVLLTWKAAAIASAIMSAPLVIRTARVTFEGVDPRLEAMARTLGHGRASTFLRVTLPLASRGLIAAAILGFARALGEFGATIIVAGNIPGRTQTLASAIYGAEQAGADAEARVLLVVSLAIGFAAIFAAERLARTRPGFRPLG